MKRLIVMFSLAALVFAGTSLAAEHTKPFKMILWGTALIPLGNNVDGYPIHLSLCRGNSNLGKFECTTTGYYVPNVDQTQWVPDSIRCGAAGVRVPLSVIEMNHTIQFENGDVLWMLPVVAPEASYVCLDATNNFAGIKQVITWQFQGGSGRFQGATGSATWELTGKYIPLVGSRQMFVAYPSPFEGTITLQ